MFNYELRRLKIEGNRLQIENIKNSSLEIQNEVIEVLNRFEDEIYKTLAKKRDSNGFKFVLGQLKRGLFDEIAKMKIDNSKVNLFLFTQHTNYIGDKIINVFSKYDTSYEGNYIVTFKGKFNSIMMDSPANSNSIVNQFEEMLQRFNLKRNLDIVFIEINGSDKLEFIQTNYGAKIKRYSLKK